MKPESRARSWERSTFGTITRSWKSRPRLLKRWCRSSPARRFAAVVSWRASIRSGLAPGVGVRPGAVRAVSVESVGIVVAAVIGATVGRAVIAAIGAKEVDVVRGAVVGVLVDRDAGVTDRVGPVARRGVEVGLAHRQSTAPQGRQSARVSSENEGLVLATFGIVTRLV